MSSSEAVFVAPETGECPNPKVSTTDDFTDDVSELVPITTMKPIRKAPHHHGASPLTLRSSLKHAHSDERTNDTYSTATSSNPSVCRHLRFDKVSVQTYSIEISDNPACSFGTPVQIAWQPDSLSEHELDAFEIERLPQRRRSPRQLVLNYYRRHQMLHEAGYDDETIQSYGNQVSRIQRQRNVTRLLLPISMFQELKISASRKVSSSWKRKPSTPKTR